MAWVCSGPEASHSEMEKMGKLLPQGLRLIFDVNPVREDDESALFRDETYMETSSVRHSCFETQPTLRYIMTSYSHTVFRCIRTLFRITDDDFRRSVCSSDAIRGGTVGEGNSNQMFFFSRDGTVLFKTLHSHEAQTLRHLLKDYLRYLREDQWISGTLLPRFFGLYQIRVIGGQPPVIFTAMNNVLYVNRPIRAKYDLKGSSWGRYTEHASEQPDVSVLLKDQNFSSVGLPTSVQACAPAPPLPADKKLRVSAQNRSCLLAQLKADCDWLRAHNLMDYSLLVGVADVHGTHWPTSPSQAASPPEPFSRYASSGSSKDDHRVSFSSAIAHVNSDMVSKHTHEEVWMHGSIIVESGDGSDLYVVGLVDVLQTFSTRKVGEWLIKSAVSVLRGGDPNAASAVPPDAYAERMLNYIRQCIVD
eukprot:CAMPEP_0185756768 /NCGR_PEP_ID=MMETSP1174-20130828/15179_1 /TAXON_ID=35687 /ORGANISM="Dictyocha speculum, Strain CCMP1381" /LENGTH=418 /DNA_ID=CAMNT_0028435881 /DNA_START=38 /DNA_END=1294 /DNA_ORIENTATION=-